MLEKYSYNLTNFCNVFKCHLVMNDLLQIVSRNGEGGELAVMIFNKNGIIDLVERIMLQCSNPLDNQLMRQKIAEIEYMGEVIESCLNYDTRTISDDNEDI